MIDLSLEIRQGIVAHLRANAALTALVPSARIFGEWADDPEFPFIRMGYANTEPFEASCWDGSEAQFDIHVFAHGPKTDAVHQIAKRVIAAMENFAPGNVHGAWAQLMRTNVLPDVVPEKLHGVITFEVVAYQEAV